MLKNANTRTQRRKNRTKNILTIIAVVVTVLIVGGLVTYMTIYNHNKALSAQNSNGNGTDTNNPDVNTAYYNEVHYVGGIGYSKVYDYEFKMTDSYISNKTLWQDAEQQDRINDCVDKATSFANAVFNINYKELQRNSEDYKQQLLSLMHSENEIQYFYDAEELIGAEAASNYITNEAFVDKLVTFLVDNEVICEATFKTDSSLVFEDDYYTYVRGVLELDIYNAKEGSLFDFDKGQTIPIMVQFTLYPSEYIYNYKIVDISQGVIFGETDTLWEIKDKFDGDISPRMIW